MVSSWKIIIATLVIYTAGLITGTFLNDLRPTKDRPQSRRDPMPRGPRMNDFIQRFGSRLDLTGTQKTNITQILKSSQQRMDALMQKMHPKIAEEFSQVNSEIKGHLTEKQATQFEALMKNRRNQGPGGPRRGFGNGPGRGEGHRDSSKGGIFRQKRGNPNQDKDWKRENVPAESSSKLSDTQSDIAPSKPQKAPSVDN